MILFWIFDFGFSIVGKATRPIRKPISFSFNPKSEI